MKAKTALVGTEGRIELHTIATVDLHLILVVFPNYAKLDDTLGDGSNLQGSLVFGILLEEGGILEGGDEFWTGIGSQLIGCSESQYWEGNAFEPLYACSNSGSDGTLVILTVVVCGRVMLDGEDEARRMSMFMFFNR